MSVIVQLTLPKLCPHRLLILALWMRQKQAWVVYGSLQDQLFHFQFILTKRIVSRILAYGVLHSLPTSKMLSSLRQILTVMLLIAI